MKPWKFMIVAGESSGDILAAELVTELRAAVSRAASNPSSDFQPLTSTLEPRFIGAGGPEMARAGVHLELDLTQHAVIGLVLKKYFEFRGIMKRLTALACTEQPDVIVLVDFSAFNRRLAGRIRAEIRRGRGPFQNWAPIIVQYVSPQVWASRPGRAALMARDYDLLLSIFPFEPAWYQKRVPSFPVAFVGHPLIDRCRPAPVKTSTPDGPVEVLLLPGSRPGELKRHLPAILGAWDLIRGKRAVTGRMVLPTAQLADMARGLINDVGLTVQVGGLNEALSRATVAVASTGTVTMECAFFGVPTVAIYITNWSTYQVGKRIIQVRHLAMPNLLAQETLFPELIQTDATAENIARETLELLHDEPRRLTVKAGLAKVIAALGTGGAAKRAAETIVSRMTRRASGKLVSP